MIRRHGAVRNMVEYEDHCYATLNCTDPTSTRLSFLQEDFIQMPVGWELAPDEPGIVRNIIAAYPWGALCLLVQGGTAYYTASAAGCVLGGSFSGCVPGEPEGARGIIAREGNGYKPNWEHDLAPSSLCRILIRSPFCRKRRRCEHSAELLAGMWRDKEFTDLTITCAGIDIRCHRAVVSRGSPVFERMIKGDMVEAQKQEIEIKDAKPCAVQSLIEFFYTGAIEEECDRLALLSLADRFQVDDLFEMSVVELFGRINQDNVAELVQTFRPLAKRSEMQVLWRRLCEDIARDPTLVSAALLAT